MWPDTSELCSTALASLRRSESISSMEASEARSAASRGAIASAIVFSSSCVGSGEGERDGEGEGEGGSESQARGCRLKPLEGTFCPPPC